MPVCPQQKRLALDKLLISDSAGFSEALEALSPSKLDFPPFSSYDADIKHADSIAAPLVSEIRREQEQEGKSGGSTLLALTLLLDQLSRNIYREPAAMKVVFTHYDRLSFALIHAALRLPERPDQDPFLQDRPVLRSWLYMPFMHSEHLASHELHIKLMHTERDAMEKIGDKEAVDYIARSLQFEEKHRIILEQFGRYPHRNAILGRESTKEEIEWLKSGDTFGIKQPQKERVQDGKSEL